MPDSALLIQQWGYLAIAIVVILGNVGFPIPEDTILILAGYLVWRGDLRVSVVLIVGVASAVAGDNLGYWIGREYGRRAIERYGHWILVTPRRLDWTQRLVTQYGARAVFAARFMPGLRFMAGPMAGVTGLQPIPFLIANLLGASMYVPGAVGIGYGIGLGLGRYLRRVEHLLGQVEHLVLLLVICGTLAILGWRLFEILRSHRAS